MATQAMAQGNEGDLLMLARGWGKIFAAEAFPDGVGPEVDFGQMEELASQGAQALMQGIVRELVRKQAVALGDTQPCPTCHSDCRVKWRQRGLQTRHGEVEMPEPMCHCTRCRRDFFPSTATSEA
ncbi:MAG: hypothetical protein EXS05_15580 [Planctomycetaceae bacterium]|nr:hypothetical protein [Planctomycetaceae bacterium]